MPRFTVSGQGFELEREGVEQCVADRLPDPLFQHYVIISGRRFPPKQVLSCATGLDRADFTTHQARRILKRLGFVAARTQTADERETDHEADGANAQAAALRPYLGQWVALSGPTEVLVAADSPQEVVAWLVRHERRASYGMFQVPRSPEEAHGAAPA